MGRGTDSPIETGPPAPIVARATGTRKSPRRERPQRERERARQLPSTLRDRPDLDRLSREGAQRARTRELARRTFGVQPAEHSEPVDGLARLTPLALPSAAPQESQTSRARAKLSLKKTEYDGTLSSIIRMLPGGRTTLMELARVAAATDEKIARFVDKWDSITNAPLRSTVPLDELCRECDFDWPRLIGACAEAAHRTGSHVASMTAMLQMPAIVERTLKYALQKDGIDDRRLLWGHAGLTPVSKGSSIAIYNSPQAIANASASSDASISPLVPFERDIAEVDDAMRTLTLPAAPASAGAAE